MSIRGNAAALVLAAIVVVGLSSRTFSSASPPRSSSEQRPSAAKQLKAAYRKLLRSGNYRASFSIRVGLSKRPEKGFSTTTFTADFEGVIFGSSRRRVVHVPSLDAYKRDGARCGIVNSGGQWMQAIAGNLDLKVRKALAIDVFDVPSKCLAQAVRFSRSARWISAEEFGGRRPEDEERPVPPSGRDGDERRGAAGGRTVVGGGGAGDAGASPGFLRVEAPRGAAVRIVTDRAVALKSGCSGAIKLSKTVRQLTRAYYDIELDPETGFPVTVSLVAITGQFNGKAGATLWKGREKVTGEADELVVSRFQYRLSGFGSNGVDMPPEARKALAGIR